MNEIGGNVYFYIRTFIVLLSPPAEAVDPLLDTAPVNIDRLRNGTTQEIFSEIKNITALLKMGESECVRTIICYNYMHAL